MTFRPQPPNCSWHVRIHTSGAWSYSESIASLALYLGTQKGAQTPANSLPAQCPTDSPTPANAGFMSPTGENKVASHVKQINSVRGLASWFDVANNLYSLLQKWMRKNEVEPLFMCMQYWVWTHPVLQKVLSPYTQLLAKMAKGKTDSLCWRNNDPLKFEVVTEIQ